MDLGAGRIITPHAVQTGCGLQAKDQKDNVKKTFQLNIEGKNRDRLLEASKHDIRKYVKRERSRALPEGVDYWDFDCKFGADEASAEPVHFATLTGLIYLLTGGLFLLGVLYDFWTLNTQVSIRNAERLGGR